jgi:CBS domain-containing protein
MKERSLRDLFHLVRQVLPEKQDLISVPPKTTVEKALEIMNEKNISQLPVVVGKEVLGVFSYRSFGENVRKLPEKERKVLSLPVEEFLEDLKFAKYTDVLTKLLDEFDLKDAVLVGSDNLLQGIITTVDALQYFYKVANPYVMLREIELAVRELIRISVNKDKLQEFIKITLKKHYEKPGQELPSNLDHLTFNDYVMLLCHKDSWDNFEKAFGGTRNTVYAKLNQIPNLRNDVFHFRRELTIEEFEILREARDWLLKRIRIVEANEEDNSGGQ